MSTVKQLQNKIENRLNKVSTLFQECIELRKQKNLLNDYYETESKCRLDYGGNTSNLKGKKQTVILGYCYSHTDDFVDEDNGEVVSIKRSLICSVNGEPCNEYGKLFKNMDYKELINWI